MANSEAHIARIQGGSYGMRDFRDGRPGIWFSVHYGPDSQYGALIAITCDEAEEFMIKNNVEDISHLDGRRCIIVDEGGLIQFISLFHPKG